MIEDYDIGEAFRKIEEELIESMIRNLKHHRAEETKEGYEWTQWQVVQLQALEEYRRNNKKIFNPQFQDINNQIPTLIELARQQGGMKQEISILKAIQQGLKVRKASDRVVGSFMRVNDDKLNALVRATQQDFAKAEHAVLRMSNDKYRKIIFDAQAYANAGGTTYEKAVDMATRDFLRAGINCIEYKNGARHTISDYADMCIKTATKRAYLTGEGEKRKEWGIATVIVNKRQAACPKCMKFAGVVLIDDVWSGGKPDGKHQLMSSAIEKGLYHPRCKDVHTTYFPGISTMPDKLSNEEKENLIDDYNEEQKQSYFERQAEQQERLAKYSLDSDNKKIYQARAKQWKVKGKNKNENIQQEEVAKQTKHDIIKLRINLFDIQDPLYLDAVSVDELDDFLDVCIHGSPQTVQKTIDGGIKNMNAKEFAKFLLESTNYNGEDIRLASCSTGQGDNSFAQQLSRELGIRVMAPDDDVFYIPDEGIMFVGSPYANTGKWRTFNKGVEE